MEAGQFASNQLTTQSRDAIQEQQIGPLPSSVTLGLCGGFFSQPSLNPLRQRAEIRYTLQLVVG